MSIPASPYSRLKTYPTPQIGDVLFYEIRTSSVAAFDNPPEYGTPHPDVNKYPHHKLVFVEADSAKGTHKWWYAADRDAQDEYNYTVSYPYNGNLSYPRYIRTYLIRREDYAPLAEGSPDPTYAGAILVAQKAEEAQAPLNSLYMQVTRVYDTVPGQGAATGDGAGQTGTGFRIERPLGHLGFVRLTWTLTLPKDIAASVSATARADLTACPIPGYTSLLLVSETVDPSDNDSQSARVVRVYRSEQNAAVPVQKKSRITSQAEPPDRFLDALQREESTLAVLAGISGSTRPADDPDGWQGSLTSAQSQSIVGMSTILEGEKTTITSRFAYGSLQKKTWDPNLTQMLTTDLFTVPRTEVDTWLANPSNVSTMQHAETEPVNRSWSVITRVTIPTMPGSGDPLNYPHVDYFTTRQYTWPRVLLGLTWTSLTGKNSSGATSFTTNRAVAKYKEPWSGSCRARIRRWWQKTKPGALLGTGFPYVEYLNPTGIVVDWPVMQVNIEECLHDQLTFSAEITANNTQYAAQGFGPEILPQTVLMKPNSLTHEAAHDWPETLVIDFDVSPYLGGYLCTHVMVYRPDNPLTGPS